MLWFCLVSETGLDPTPLVFNFLKIINLFLKEYEQGRSDMFVPTLEQAYGLTKVFLKFSCSFLLSYFLNFVFFPKSTVSAECLNVRDCSNIRGSHEISSKCAVWGQGICERTWEEPQQINKDFWGLIKVYKETEIWCLCVCEPCEGVCLVARTLVTVSWTFLCLKNKKSFPEPLGSLFVSVLKLPGAFLGPWLFKSQKVRASHCLIFSCRFL